MPTPRPTSRSSRLGDLLVEDLLRLFEYVACHAAGWIVRLPPVREGRRLPVVLVPGLIGRGLFWYRLRGDLVRAGHPVHVLDFGFQLGRVRPKGAALERYLEREDLRDAVVVAHSMGGLITAAMSDAGWQRVRRLIAIATPWQGSRLASCLPFSPAMWDLAAGSPLVTGLARDLPRRPVTNLVARLDTVVWPNANARLPAGGDERVLPIDGHLTPVMGPVGRRLLLRAVTTACQPAGGQLASTS